MRYFLAELDRSSSMSSAGRHCSVVRRWNPLHTDGKKSLFIQHGYDRGQSVKSPALYSQGDEPAQGCVRSPLFCEMRDQIGGQGGERGVLAVLKLGHGCTLSFCFFSRHPGFRVVGGILVLGIWQLTFFRPPSRTSFSYFRGLCHGWE